MLEMVVVWLPHIIWHKLGIPPQPPCPEHGFPDEGEDDFVMSKGMARPRRFCGVTRDTSGFIVGSLHMCTKCKAEKDQMADESVEKKAKHYHFRAYNPGVISQYLQHPKFSFVGSELQLLRLTHRRAVTADFERLVCSSAASAGGSNVSAQQKLLSELHTGGRGEEEEEARCFYMGAPRKEGGTAKQEMMREKQRAWAATSRAKAKSKREHENENSSAAASE